MRQQKNIACAVAAALSIVIVISTVVCIVLFSYPNNKAPSSNGIGITTDGPLRPRIISNATIAPTQHPSTTGIPTLYQSATTTQQVLLINHPCGLLLV